MRTPRAVIATHTRSIAPDYHWAVPGHGFFEGPYSEYIKIFRAYFRKSKFRPKKFREEMINGAIRDGLVSVSEPIECAKYYLVALFFPQNDTDYNDFHWYRMDDDRQWSQKCGPERAKATNCYGKPMTVGFDNPVGDGENNVYDSYYAFFGRFFLVPREKEIVLTRNKLPDLLRQMRENEHKRRAAKKIAKGAGG